VPNAFDTAGAFDRLFGKDVSRSVPTGLVVQLTSTYNPASGYSWVEFRSARGIGFTQSALPLRGDQAYDINGNTSWPVGAMGTLTIDRDQTCYVLTVLLTVGSGSGSYCAAPTPTAQVACSNGSKILTVYDLDITSSGARLELTECSSTEFNIGPCSQDNPEGSTIVVTTSVCPIYSTIEYLNWSSQPVSIQVVTGIQVQRQAIVVPVVNALVGCSTNMTTCCESGSGSGSGSGTVTNLISTCIACSTMSSEWELIPPDGSGPYILIYQSNTDDGNTCTFWSSDLQWELYYDIQTASWVLYNYNTDSLWALSSALWQCCSSNALSSETSGTGSAIVIPVFSCGSSGSGGSGSGGSGSGSGVSTPCCTNSLPTILYASFGGSLAPLGLRVPLIWNGSVTTPVWIGTANGCGGATTITFSCLLTDFSISLFGGANGTAGASAASCVPLVWNSGPFGIDINCSGTGTATVTQ
jgi:hypothetical protein